MSEILIKNGLVITMDKHRRIFLGDLLIQGEKIAAVEKAGKLKLDSEPETVIDAKNKVVLPGFLNIHTHLPSIYVRGVYGVVAEGLTSILFPMKFFIKPHDMYIFGLASCVEAIYGGTTTIVENYNYVDHFAKAVNETGLKAVLGEQIIEADLLKIKDNIYDYLPDQADKALKRAKDQIKTWKTNSDDRIKPIVAPLALDMTTDQTYMKCKELADDNNLELTTHLSQSWGEIRQVKKIYGMTPPEKLFKMGVINNKFSGAHCYYVTEKDRLLLAKCGATILHCPRPYTIEGSTFPLLRSLDMGIKIGLGTDNVYHSMNETMRAGIYSARFRALAQEGYDRYHTGERPTCMEMLELATIRGAEAMNLDQTVGSLEVGKKADVIIYSLASPHLTPTVDPLSSIVLYGSSSDIETSIINGRIVKEKHQIKGVNIARILADAQERANELWKEFFISDPQSRKTWEKYIPNTLNDNNNRDNN